MSDDMEKAPMSIKNTPQTPIFRPLTGPFLWR